MANPSQRSGPVRADLDQLRKFAKELLKAYRAGDAQACARLRASLPAAAGQDDDALAAMALRLHDAQSCIARENGFASWPQLKEYVEAQSAANDVAGALRTWKFWTFGGGYRPARPHLALRLREQRPDLLEREPALAGAIGDIDAVRARIASDPAWARQRSSKDSMSPLACACFSGFLRVPTHAAKVRQVVALLLDAGADANDAMIDPAFPGDALSVLYGAAGRNHDAETTRLLLAAGADPDDNESLYHATEADDDTCLRLLLEAGARIGGTNAMLRVLDFEQPGMLRRLLEHGGDANERTGAGPLLHAIRRRRSARVIGMLLDAGADPGARDAHGNGALKLAARMGMVDVAALLRAAGATDDVDGDERERFVAACSAADRVAAMTILARRPRIVSELDPAQTHLLPELAAVGNDDGVRLMVELGWPIATRGGDIGGSALNWAVFRGNAPLARFLLAHGASVDERHDYDDNVYGTLAFASNARPPGPGDWLGCAHALHESGAPLPDERYDFAEDVAVYFDGLR